MLASVAGSIKAVIGLLVIDIGGGVKIDETSVHPRLCRLRDRSGSVLENWMTLSIEIFTDFWARKRVISAA